MNLLAGLLAGLVKVDDFIAAVDPDGWEWSLLARCAETYPDAFYPEDGRSAQPAKRVCGACEVRPECLAYALVAREPYGVWGGLTERQRRRLRSSETTEADPQEEQVAA